MTSRKRGQWRTGERHPRSRATDDDVRMAIELVEKYGLTSAEVADKFGVSASCVRRWANGSRRGTFGDAL